MLADINVERGKALQTKLGANTLFIYCDVADWSSQILLFKTATEWAGIIDLFLANAGIEEMKHFSTSLGADGQPTKPDMPVFDVDLHAIIYSLKLFRHYTKTSAVAGKIAKFVTTNNMAGIYEFLVAPLSSAAKHGVTLPSTTCLL